MSQFSAKNLLCLLAFASLLLYCSREGDEPLWVPETHLGSKDYNGGHFLVWIKLKSPVEDASSITWRAGKNAQIAKRKQGMNSKDEIIADTAFFHWETPPEPTEICVTVDNNCESRKIYLDTIFAIVNGMESAPIIIEIKNILPRVTSLKVGGLMRTLVPGDDSILVIAAHPGDNLEIELHIEKAFNKDNSPRVYMPLDTFGGSMRLKQQSDNLYSWEWEVPNRTVDDSLYLKIEDSGGYGERLYKIHLISYVEFGSVWVASENEIAKFSPNGKRVLSIRDGGFSYISDITVLSNPRVTSSEKLFVVDQYKNTLSIYDTYGTQIYKDSLQLRNPTSIAVDIEGLYVWIADSSTVTLSSGSNLGSSSSNAAGSPANQSRFRLRAFDFSSGTLGKVAHRFEDFTGAIRGLSTDKYDRTRLWFTLPEIDTVGFVRYNLSTGDSKVRYIKPSKSKWNRPSMVSLDPINGLAWVADSSRIVAIMESDKEDENEVIIGEEKAIVEGFGFVSAVSASRDSVWATDILAGKVYKFYGPFDGTKRVLDYVVADGIPVDAGGFLQPSFVSAYVADYGGAWVMDRGKGEIVRVNSKGERIVAGTGLRPLIGKTIQKVE
jgi:hypothetical protein